MESQKDSAGASGEVIGSANVMSDTTGGKASADEPTPEMLESMTTATAQITRGDGSKLDIRSIDHEFGRLMVETNEVLTIRLALRDVDNARGVLLEADNGGSLNRQLGPVALLPLPGDGAIEFQYAIGGHRGKYTLFATQGDRQELLEFIAGQEPPTGQSGPPRYFNPKQS